MKISWKVLTLSILCLISHLEATEDRFYLAEDDRAVDSIVVEPKVIDIPSAKPTSRSKRSSQDDLEEDLSRKLIKSDLVLDVEGWILILDENTHLSFYEGFHEVGNDVKCKLYLGSVLYDPGSSVAMTVCNASTFYGLVETGGGVSFFVEPTTEPPGGHLLYRSKREARSKRCSNCASSEGFNMTGDLFDDANFDFTGDVAAPESSKVVKYEDTFDYRTRKARHDYEDDIGYFVDVAWETRPYIPDSHYGKTESQERWLEMALAVDYTVIDFHGKEKIKPYIMTLMNIVSAIYKEPSLDANMHLVLSRLFLYESKKDSQIKEGNAKKSLEAVNRWNYHLIKALPKDEEPHDIAVWLTREYIGGPSGYAPVAGVCDKSRSTALNKDEGLASAFIIAHEMAHILGLTHDGDEKAANKCGDEVEKGTVMAPTVTAAFNRFTWSSCSNEEFHRLIKRWTCLLNPPLNNNLLEEESSYTFSMDEQCRMEFGEGYGICKSFELIEPCTHLWCGHENSSMYCFTKKGPPVEGTQCGFDKWCVDGYCQTVDGQLAKSRSPAPVNGAWGSWTEWGPCSRPCGYGTRKRERRCDNPEPEFDGAPCTGEDSETEVCKNERHCWDHPTLDSRAEACTKMGQSDSEEWLPYEGNREDLMCQVSCVLWSTGEVVRTGQNLPDGTPCSYANDHDICIQGKCHKLGCDGLENSTLVEDICGECDGGGRSCLNSYLVSQKILRKEHTKITVFPKHSREISIRITLKPIAQNNRIQNLNLPYYISIKVGGSDKLYKLRGPVRYGRQRPESPDVVEEASIVIAGTSFKMTKRSSTIHLTAKGPLYEEVAIMTSASLPHQPNQDQSHQQEAFAATAEASVELNYTLATSSAAAGGALYSAPIGRYALRGTPSGGCSCGPRPPGPHCVDTLHDNQVVDSRRCLNISSPAAKKGWSWRKEEREDCSSVRCEYRWVPGKWEHCTATCGDAGIQHRQLYCIPNDIDDEVLTEKPWWYMVEPNRCPTEKPSSRKACNRNSCPVNWVEEPWSECSSTCGRGKSTMTMRCVSSRNSTVDCGPTPAPKLRSCQGSCPHKPCQRDKSQNCFLLASRYCVWPEFEKICCVSCNKHIHNIH